MQFNLWHTTVYKEKNTSMHKQQKVVEQSVRKRNFPNFAPGELAERSIAAVLKTVEVLKPPGVRIPNSPPKNRACKCRPFLFSGFFAATYV